MITPLSISLELVYYRTFLHPQINLRNAKILMDDGFTLSQEAGAGRVMFDNQHPVACWTEDDGNIEVRSK